MKKQYNRPTVKVKTMDVCQAIAQSGGATTSMPIIPGATTGNDAVGTGFTGLAKENLFTD